MIRLLDQTVASLPAAIGFRTGRKGVHNTRSMMLADLDTLLAETSADTSAEAYRRLVVEDNVLGKTTDSTRRYTAQRMRELYALDPDVPLFRIFRRLWDASQQGRPLLALLLVLARDPLLRLTAEPILGMEAGAPFDKAMLRAPLAERTGERFSNNSLDKIARITASTWTQGGLLEGRYNKVRRRPPLAPTNTAYALLMGYLCGVRGQRLFDTFWAQILDAPTHEVHEHARAASRRSLMTYRNAGGLIDLDFAPLLTSDEQRLAREQS
jgi:hypothetical protein